MQDLCSRDPTKEDCAAADRTQIMRLPPGNMRWILQMRDMVSVKDLDQ